MTAIQLGFLGAGNMAEAAAPAIAQHVARLVDEILG